jgi:peptide/nickel transport system substrate-binding protein
MKIRSTRHVVALFAALSLALTACAGAGGESSGDGEPQRGGTLTYLVSGDLASLDPGKLVGGASSSAPTYALFDALLVINAKTGEVEPKLATSLTPDKSAMTWTLELRKDVEFSDGTPYDAAAVKYNWERAAKLKGSLLTDAVAPIKRMTVKSPSELEIELSAPNSAFDRVVARRLWMIGSPTAIKKAGDEVDTKPVGAGPFVLKKWVRDSTKTFIRNENYYDAPRPYVDNLTIQVAPDTSQSQTLLRSGGADMGVYWDAGVVEKLTSEGLQASKTLNPGAPNLAMNINKAPFDDPRVRRAVALAVDTEQAAKVVPGFVPAAAPFPNKAEYNYGMTWPEPDPKEAQKLFDEYAAEHGGTVEFAIGAFQDPGNQAEVKYLQAVLNEFDNVKVEVNVQAAATAVGNVLSQNYQAHTWGSPWWTPADLSTYLRTGASFNVFGFSDPAVDKALDKAQSTTDPEVQNEAYKIVVEALVTGLPMVAYGAREIGNVYTDEVHDVKVSGDGLVYFEQIWKNQ